MTAVYAIILFVLLIFPHELGHFIVAKAVGVKVNEFSFGMGPAIYKKEKGETTYSIRLVPVGGYCAMEGEDEDSDDSRSFGNQSAWGKNRNSYCRSGHEFAHCNCCGHNNL